MTRTDFVASLRDMNDSELDRKISRLRSEIFTETSAASTYGMAYAEKGKSNEGLRPLKRELARALTIQQERSKGINQ